MAKYFYDKKALKGLTPFPFLGEVKTEYGKFGSVLDAVRKKLASATNEIDNAYTRHRAIGRKLRDVEAVESDSPDLLPEPDES